MTLAMRIYLALMAALCLLSLGFAVFQRETGEGFVRGLNVVFTFLLVNGLLLLLASVPALVLLYRLIRLRDLRQWWQDNRRSLALLAIPLVVPLLSGIILNLRPR